MFSRLTTTQLDRLHAASLEVMERTGVRLRLPRAGALLKRAGCHVSNGDRVRFPPAVVEESLRTAPRELRLFNQRGEPAMHLAGRAAYYGNGSDLLYIIDHGSGKRRRPVLQDVADMAAVIDALPDMDFVMSGFIPTDVPPETVQRQQMLAMMEHTAKPIVYVTTDAANTRACVHMAQLAAGGEAALAERPFAVNYINIANPLRHNPASLEKLMWLSERNLPFVYRPSIVTRGISTPVTWAGFLVVNNVAALAGLVLSQLVREGAPFIRCGCSGGTFDMRSMVGQHAAPEIRGHNEDMAEYYGLPRFGIGGLCGSKTVDQQAALESALTLLASAQAGAQLIHDVGYMDNGTTGALDQLVICHEIIGWVKQYMRELEVTDETLALDVIQQVVDADEDFLQTEHTAAHYRDDHYPGLLDRGHYDTWHAEGKQTLRDKARASVNAILEAHTRRDLPGRLVERLEAFALEHV